MRTYAIYSLQLLIHDVIVNPFPNIPCLTGQVFTFDEQGTYLRVMVLVILYDYPGEGIWYMSNHELNGQLQLSRDIQSDGWLEFGVF